MSNIIQGFVNELPENQSLGIVISVIVIGLLLCFFGYKLMRVGITILGFSIGFFITAFLVNYFVNNNWITFPAAIIVGLLIAFIAFRLYEAGVFLVCGICTTVMIITLLMNYGSTWVYVAAIAAGILGGILAVFFIKPASIFQTAMGGGIITVVEICEKFSFDNTMVIFIAGIVLGLIGILFQFSFDKKKKISS